jgi:ABC-type sugar transport system permease subunit
MFRDPIFVKALRNTFVFTVVYNVIMISLATVLAVALDSQLVRAKGFFRSAYFAPVTVSLAVAAMLFDVILGREFGMLNMILRALGFAGRTHWLGDPDLALYAFIAMRIWRSTGYYAAIILAGLQSIPGDFLDAARVDGAGPLTMFFRITLPLLRPTMLFVVVTSTIVSLQVFDEPWILNQGGPANSTLSLVMYIYAQGFNFLRLGYGSALSIVFTLILLVFAAVEMKLLGEQVEE